MFSIIKISSLRFSVFTITRKEELVDGIFGELYKPEFKVILTMVNKFSSSKRGIRVSLVKLAEEKWDLVRISRE